MAICIVLATIPVKVFRTYDECEVVCLLEDKLDARYLDEGAPRYRKGVTNCDEAEIAAEKIVSKEESAALLRNDAVRYFTPTYNIQYTIIIMLKQFVSFGDAWQVNGTKRLANMDRNTVWSICCCDGSHFG